MVSDDRGAGGGSRIGHGLPDVGDDVPVARLGEPETALNRALSRVGDRWSLLVVDSLLEGPRRFNELQELLGGIATNILSHRLKSLEAEGVVIARPYSERPPRFSYELTASGTELAGVLRLLAQWGSDPAGETSGNEHVTCGTPMEARWYCPTCDRLAEDDEAEGVQYI